jgi:hypothetical protein
MIVRDLNVPIVPVYPSKADTPLSVDANAHLPCPIAFQRFELIARRITQVVNGHRGIKLAQLPKRSILNVRRNLRLL